METYGYPWRRLFKTKQDLYSAFNRIRDYEFHFITSRYKIANIPNFYPDYEGKQIIIVSSPNEYETTNWISDWFNEESRIKCKRYDESMSQYEYWQKNKTTLLSKNLSIRELNDEIYKNIRGCNNFRPGIIVGFIKMFNSKSVLDISAGWGDRLIGAIAAGVDYLGVDPNPDVHIGYCKILKEFGKEIKRNPVLIQDSFQDAKIPEARYFDLVFTSPPYFDLEHYGFNEKQSIIEFSNVEDWYNKFLIKSLLKAWNLLARKGWMAININDAKNKTPYTLRMVRDVSLFPGAKYHGCISYAEFDNKNNFKSPQPVWIWSKE